MRRHVLTAIVIAFGAITVQQSGTGPARAHAPTPSTGSPVYDWNQHTAEAARTSGISPALDPLHESRLYAMVHIAIHDALNSIDRRFEPYAFDITAKPSASPDAAVATAAHDVLVPALNDIPAPFDPASIAKAVADVEQAYTDALADIPDGAAKDHGIVIGKAAAAFILAERVDDGAGDVLLVDTDYPEGDDAGEYRFPADSQLAFAPLWYEVPTFVLRDGSQFMPRPPYDVRSKKYAADVNEVKLLGSKTSMSRSAPQTEIAYFWWESSPDMWNRIAVTVAGQAGLDLWEQARLFALMNMGMADGYIGNWYSKYAVYNRWRPETAIREPVSDRNPLTTPDPTWEALIPTGATPSYDSGHSIEGAVAAGVMAQVIGTDDIEFEACTLTPDSPLRTCDVPNPTLRTFDSLSQAARENGESRIYVGWHFRDDVEQGLKHGDRIADRAVTRFLRPAHG
jgi:hypothetical protein